MAGQQVEVVFHINSCDAELLPTAFTARDETTFIATPLVRAVDCHQRQRLGMPCIPNIEASLRLPRAPDRRFHLLLVGTRDTFDLPIAVGPPSVAIERHLVQLETASGHTPIEGALVTLIGDIDEPSYPRGDTLAVARTDARGVASLSVPCDSTARRYAINVRLGDETFGRTLAFYYHPAHCDTPLRTIMRL
jgi:hypothetical protein